MDKEKIKEKALSIIYASVPDLKGVKIEENSNINTDASVDSMSFIFLMTQIESGFDVKIPQKKWNKLTTFGALVDEIELRLAKSK